MQVTDLNGNAIEVTDLDLGIMQADDFRHYRVAEPTEKHLQLYAYWEDLYQKLVRLREQQNN